MSKKSSPAVIGAFVVGAVALLAVSVALFGGSKFFAQRVEYVAYFQQGTKGLRVGSNVLLNGVPVGYVSEVALLMDEASFTSLTRVTLEVLPESFLITDSGKIVGKGSENRVPHSRLIQEAGLRAMLETESLVTGQLVVSLTLRPETVAIMRGVDPPHDEIPTIPSPVQAFLAKLAGLAEEAGENLDVKEVAQHLSSILEGFDELANSQDIRDTLARVNELVQSPVLQDTLVAARELAASPDVREALAGLNKLINDPTTQGLSAKLQSILGETESAVVDARQLIGSAQGDLGSITENLGPALTNLTQVLLELQQGLQVAKEQLRGESTEMRQLQDTLAQIEAAASAVRSFFDFFERNPEALLRGKK